MCHCVPQRERRGNPFGNLSFMTLLMPHCPLRLTSFQSPLTTDECTAGAGYRQEFRRVGGRVIERGTAIARYWRTRQDSPLPPSMEVLRRATTVSKEVHDRCLSDMMTKVKLVKLSFAGLLSSNTEGLAGEAGRKDIRNSSIKLGTS
ncbi:hypothetical protein LCGC14_1600280 [marine sediment metagenome]|uniref:Uncharacterized protein n=1 Tax=marine sediment metagenome TaxID=412755 RepID=A0A0F9IBN6_9ZZZZ